MYVNIFNFEIMITQLTTDSKNIKYFKWSIKQRLTYILDLQDEAVFTINKQ